jgi:predicted chitinase
MVSEFKFFHGIIKTKFTVHWNPEIEQDLNSHYAIDAEAELTRIMSEEIARGIDEEIINTITRRINGGSNHGIDYLNHWLRIGENRA